MNEPTDAVAHTAEPAAAPDAGPMGDGSAADPPAAAPGAYATLAAVEAQAAAHLAAVYRELPGVVRELIGGPTVADVQAALAVARRAYADIRAAVLADLSAGVPPAHGASAPPPAPASPFALIRAGVAAHGE